MKQKTIRTSVKGIIKKDGLIFKDLFGDGQLKPYEDWRLSAEERAKDLVSRMTDEEKAGMFVIVDQKMGISCKNGEPTSRLGVLSEYEGPGIRGSMSYPTTYQLTTRHIRHLIVRENAKPHEFARWINTLQEVCEGTRLGIPCIVAANSKNESADIRYNADKEDNQFTTYPGTLGIAASRNMDIVKEFAQTGRREFLASGIRKGYMYMADCATDPRWFRTFGTFGENPELISRIIPELIRIYQGEQLDETGIALTVKHFPGGGARENGFDPHYAEGKYNVYATPGSLETYHLPPFRAAIQAHPSAVMPYYAIPSNAKSSVPQKPFDGPFEEEIAFAYNRQFITGLLRETCGFDGYVNSDTGVLDKMAWGAEEMTKPQRAARVLQAGTDMVSGEADPQPFLDAIKENLVDRQVVDRALVRLFKELFALGLFENPYVDEEAADSLVNTPKSRKQAYKAHLESVVALKNHGGLLPLTEEKTRGKKIYVELFCKDDYTEKELETMALSGSRVDPAKTISDFAAFVREDHPEWEFVDDYREADVAVLMLNPTSGSYFEATPSYLELNILEETGIHLEQIRQIRAAVPQVVMHVNLNLPFLMTNVEPLADALTVGFCTFGQAAMDVISGRANPKGKLPITLPGSDAAIAVDENGICASPNDVPGYDKAKYMKDGMTYAYQDSDGSQYIYGFGLTW